MNSYEVYMMFISGHKKVINKKKYIMKKGNKDLLKLILSNQVLIMKALKIEIPIKKEIEVKIEAQKKEPAKAPVKKLAIKKTVKKVIK